MKTSNNTNLSENEKKANEQNIITEKEKVEYESAKQRFADFASRIKQQRTDKDSK